MIISSSSQRATYQEACHIATNILAQMRDAVAPGVYPIELDRLAGKLCRQYKVKPSFKGVNQSGSTYAHNSCISVNDEVLHGIPNSERALKVGDLVKLDFGIIHQGLFTDQCVTVGVKELSKADFRLIKRGKEAVLNGVAQAIAGNRAGDVGHAMHSTAYRAGFDVLKEYIGHGIGTHLHEDPELPAYGKPNTGQKLEKNMVVCVEAQIVPGSDQVYVTDNGWTVKTVDEGKGVMFEYMVLIGNKPTILTDTRDWPLVV